MPAFEFDGRQVAESRVAPPRIVEAFDELEDGGSGFGLGLEPVPRQQLAFQPRWLSAGAFARWACARRWVRSATPTTTPWPRAARYLRFAAHPCRAGGDWQRGGTQAGCALDEGGEPARRLP